MLDREIQLGLNKVYFERYENAIKRYGYTGVVRDQGFEEISREINLDYADFQKDKHSAHYLYYKNEFIVDHGNYDTNKLLLLGFLLCSHQDSV